MTFRIDGIFLEKSKEIQMGSHPGKPGELVIRKWGMVCSAGGSTDLTRVCCTEVQFGSVLNFPQPNAQAEYAYAHVLSTSMHLISDICSMYGKRTACMIIAYRLQQASEKRKEAQEILLE